MELENQNATPQSQPAPPQVTQTPFETPPLPPSSNKNWLLWGGIGILILLLLATTSYFAYQNMQAQNQTAETAPIPSTGKITKQETYTDPEGRFSFQYPGNWFMKSKESFWIGPSRGNGVIMFDTENFSLSTDPLKPDPDRPIMLNVVTHSSWVDNPHILGTEQKEFNGILWTYREGIESEREAGDEYKIWAVTVHNNTYYRWLIPFDLDEGAFKYYRETLNEMLSSFKFSDAGGVESYEIRKMLINEALEAYMNSIDWTWTTREGLNEWHSIEEERQFYLQESPVFTVKVYENNDTEGTIAIVTLAKNSNGVWRVTSSNPNLVTK